MRALLVPMVVVCVSCHDAETTPSTTNVEDSAVSEGGFDIGGLDVGLVDTAFDRTPFDATWSGPTDAPDDAPDPPAVHCGASESDEAGADAGLCDPPPSICADPWWLVYYTNGRCVDGACRYDKATLFCNLGCSYGGCVPRSTGK